MTGTKKMEKTAKKYFFLTPDGSQICRGFKVYELIMFESKIPVVVSPGVVELHPYLPQEQLITFSKSKGIVVTAYSPLGSPGRPASFFPDKATEPIVLENPVLKAIAEKHNTSTALVALAWGIKRGTPVLPKAVSENHIKENLEALHVKLDEDDMKAIENIGIRHRYFDQTFMYKTEELPEDFWDNEY